MSRRNAAIVCACIWGVVLWDSPRGARAQESKPVKPQAHRIGDDQPPAPSTLQAPQITGPVSHTTAETLGKAKTLAATAAQTEKKGGATSETKGEPGRQGGDTCATAFVIPSIPFSDTGTTAGYTDDYDEICPFDTPGAPDVVYSYTPASSGMIDISLCTNSAYDTKLYVYANSCGSYQSNTFVACNDDACSTPSMPNAFVSSIYGLSVTGGTTYYIVVDGYEGANGAYTIDVSETLPPPTCPQDSLYGQNPSTPADAWSFGVSDADFLGGDIVRYESFSGLGGMICDVHWWGIKAYFDGLNWGTVQRDSGGLRRHVLHGCRGGRPVRPRAHTPRAWTARPPASCSAALRCTSSTWCSIHAAR